MRKNKFLAALAIAACLATSVPFSVNAATPGQAKDASKVQYGSVSVDNKAVLKKLFNAEYYKAQNPDLAAAGITTEDALFNHFVNFGVFEGRACCDGFNVAAYKSAYKDLQAAFGNDIVAYYVHFQNFGKTEKRALVTVEAATAAGVTVVSAADGTTVAAAAPAAAATSTAAPAVAAEAEKAPFAENVAEDPDTGKFYDKTKAGETQVVKGVLDGYVAINGKYYKTVTKADATGVDPEKYGNVGSTYYDKATKTSKLDVTEKGLDPKKYVKVGELYYYIVEKDDAYIFNNGYTSLTVSDKKRYFEIATASGNGYKLEAADNYVADDLGYYYAVVSEEAYKGVSVSDSSLYKKIGDKIVKISDKKTAAEAPERTKKVAIAPYVDLTNDKDLKTAAAAAGLSGIHKEVTLEVAKKFNETGFGKAGDTYYKKTVEARSGSYLGNPVTEEVAGAQEYVKDGWILTGGYAYKVVKVDDITAIKSGYALTGKDTYYSTVEIDASVATGPVTVAKEGSVYVKKDAKAYKEVKFEDAFVKKEGFKVVKNEKDGCYYYSK